MAIKPRSCIYGKCIIPQRYILTFMTFTAIINCYTMRMCLYTMMDIESTQESHRNKTSADCPTLKDETYSAVGPKYDWSAEQRRIILTSFFIGYLIMHVPGGILSDKYGGKHILSLSVFLSALFTVLTPVTISNCNWWLVVALRFFLGLAQGSLYPAVASLLSYWIPTNQRGLLGSIVFSGMQIGMIFGMYCSGLMVIHFGSWTVVFYIWGIISVFWCLLFLLTCYSDPVSHPYITQEEKNMLEEEFGHRSKAYKIPWKKIYLDDGCWALVIAQCGHDWITYTVEIDFPLYLRSVLKFTIDQDAWISVIPFAAMLVSAIISGWLADYLINNDMSSVVGMRKTCTTISSVGPSTLALIGTYMGCNRDAAVAFFVLGVSSMGPYYPGLSVNVFDISLNFSGVLMSLVNGIGVIAAIMAPYLVAYVAVEHTIVEWQTVFWVTYVVCTVTNIIYLIWASGDRAEWDRLPQE